MSEYAQEVPKGLAGKAQSLAANEHVPAKPAKAATKAPATAPAATASKAQPFYHKTSTAPFFPGQQPAYRIPAGRAGTIPVYVYGHGKPGPTGNLQTVLGGPAKGQTLGQSQQALAKVYRQNHPVGQQIIAGIANTVPGVSVAKAIRDNKINTAAVASEAVNDITSGLLPAGKAAGIIGGIRGLRKVAETAKAIDVGSAVKESGSAADALRGTLKGARAVRGKQEADYSVERAQRFANASKYLNDSTLSPEQRLTLAKGELKGELPKIDFQGMKVLDENSLKHLQAYILDHPHLLPGQKIHAAEALSNALAGKVPTNSELTLLEHVFGKDTAAGLGSISSHPLKDLVLSTLNVPRSLMASFDLSAPFRQGIVTATRHPVIFARNFKPMVKAFGSERVYQGVLADIHGRPTYPMMLEAKLAITELGKQVGPREERFASDVAEHIPIAGRGIRASGRAYTGFLDKMRADVFDHLIQRAQDQGINVQDEKFLKSLGTYINSATGRGNLGHFQEAGKVLNTFFFSPRLLASRLNFMNPLYYARLDPFARKEALRSAIQLAGTLSTLLGVASQIPGAKVVSDPRNPDWGKIRLGNTRIDIAGGFQQPLRLFAQLATGTAISSTTGKKLNLTANGFGQPTRLDLFLRFFEGKESPWASFVTDFLRNSNQVGQKFQLDKEVYQRIIPLLAQDSYDLYNAHHGGMNGLAAAFAGYGVGSVGFGLQTYGPKQPKARVSSSYDPYVGRSSSGGSDYAQPSASTGSPYAQP